MIDEFEFLLFFEVEHQDEAVQTQNLIERWKQQRASWKFMGICSLCNGVEQCKERVKSVGMKSLRGPDQLLVVQDLILKSGLVEI